MTSDNGASQPTAAPAVMNRGMVVVGAILIQLCLGAIYAWSVFTPSLKTGNFSFSTEQTQWIFSVGLATFAVTMVLAGLWQAKVGPTVVARVGGLVLGIGYVLGGLATRTMTGDGAFWALLLTIGFVGGAGIGLAYVVPIAVGVKWFPDRKGMITGLAVAGFGFGALIWVKLAGSWGHLIDNMGLANVFLAYGVAFFVLVMIGSIWMKNPPEGWLPAGWSPPAATGASAAATGSGYQFEWGQMLGTGQFYMLWFMFIVGALAGLMVIGIIKLFGIDALQARGGMSYDQASAAAGTAMAVFFAIANGLGRICWGIMSDKLGRKMSLVLMSLTQGVVMLVFFYAGGNEYLLYAGAALIGFNFGGNFALFPAATADYFGNKNVGKNYGWMFTAYGVGGIVGPIMAGKFRDAGAVAVNAATTEADKLAAGLDAWFPAFIIAGVACLVATVVGMLLKPPRVPAAQGA
jgi:OFA family oxalate/formate antiporter-like MFS transporter